MFYAKKLDFELIKETYQSEQDKRGLVIAAPNCLGTSIGLAKGSKNSQHPFIGK